MNSLTVSVAKNHRWHFLIVSVPLSDEHPSNAAGIGSQTLHMSPISVMSLSWLVNDGASISDSFSSVSYGYWLYHQVPRNFMDI